MRDENREAALRACLRTKGAPIAPVQIHDVLPSTNDVLRTEALAGAPHGTVVWAHTQTAGKGSRGRSFCSPDGGLYFSVLLRDWVDPMQITCAAAAATHEAIRRVLHISTQIKWVNDLYLDGRKVCGILCEGVTVGSKLCAAVLGIGINLVTPSGGFPIALKDIAGGLLTAPPADDVPLTLIAEILSLLHAYLADPTQAYMDCYRANNMALSKQVCYHLGGVTKRALVQEITDRGSLLLLCEDGTVCEALSGEITFENGFAKPI